MKKVLQQRGGSPGFAGRGGRSFSGAPPVRPLLALLALASCTDTQLYKGTDIAFQNDRLAIGGRFCTVDPAQQRFPVKIAFVIDTSSTIPGIDPNFYYAQAAGDVINRYVNSFQGNYSFAVIGYGGKAQLLSADPMNPGDESFTRRPDLLQNAVQRLRLPIPCQGTTCRDLQSGLALAGSLITGDVLSAPKGDVARTRYVIVTLASGPPIPRITKCQCGNVAADPMCMNPPMISDQDCETSIYLKQLQAVIDQVHQAGAKELRFHSYYLSDALLMPPPNHVEGVALLQQLSSAGGGAFACTTAPMLPADQTKYCSAMFPMPQSATAMKEYASCLKLPMVCPGGVTTFLNFSLNSAQAPFLVKKLVVANLNTVAGATGPRLDSDGDGLPDDDETQLGTRPDLSDTDGDGISDFVEVRLGLNPLMRDPPPAACTGIDFTGVPGTPLPDTDGDLLNDCEEHLLGTDPTLADTDGDGLPDGLELRAGTNYLSADYLIPPYDHDGIPNGDEVRQHTAPRLDDTADGLSHAYAYIEDSDGVKPLPYGSQPRDITGVSVLDVSPGSTPGAGTLRYWSGPLPCDKLFAPPRDQARDLEYQRCQACPTCSALQWKDAGDCDFGPAHLIDVDAVRQSGGVTLVLESHSVSGAQCTTPGLPMPPPMSDFRLSVRVEDANVLRKITMPDALGDLKLDETIVVGTAMRACERYQVTNITLLTPVPNQSPGFEESLPGMNNVYVYFGQAPAGQLTDPGVFSTALVRVRYAPPAKRDPADPEVVLGQNDFVVLGGN